MALSEQKRVATHFVIKRQRQLTLGARPLGMSRSVAIAMSSVASLLGNEPVISLQSRFLSSSLGELYAIELSKPFLLGGPARACYAE